MPPLRSRVSGRYPITLPKQLLAQGSTFISGSIAAPVLQLRHDVVSKVLPGFRHDDASQVEAIDLALIDPGAERIRHLLRVAHNGFVAAAQRELLQQLTAC